MVDGGRGNSRVSRVWADSLRLQGLRNALLCIRKKSPVVCEGCGLSESLLGMGAGRLGQPQVSSGPWGRAVSQRQEDQAGERMSKFRMTTWAGTKGQGKPGLHGTGSSVSGYNTPLAAKVVQLDLLVPHGLLPGLAQDRKRGDAEL
jgi:hypothetical protein